MKKQSTSKIKRLHKILNFIIASVWLINGLYCKVLNFVPRHEQIAARIIGMEYSRIFIVLIGISESIMAIWVLSAFRSKLSAITQILVVASMNVLEFLFVPDLLLWGRYNALFASLFIGLVFYNEFVLKRKLIEHAI